MSSNGLWPGGRYSRRGFLTGAGGMLAAGLVGCGGTGTDPRSIAPAGPGFPVEIPNRYGTARIPSAPKEIVSLGPTDHDVLLPLGVLPAGLTPWGTWESGVGPWVEPMPRGNPKLLGSEIDVEAVAALRPDLLIAVQSALSSDQYERLDLFAPLVAQPPNSIDFGVPWHRQADIIGRAVGKPAEARTLIDRTQERIDRDRQENPVLHGKTHVTVRADSAGTYAAYTGQDARTILLEQLGLRLSPNIARMPSHGQFYIQISKEQVSLLDADVVIVTPATPTDVDAVRNDPMLNNLRAAKEGGLILVEDYDLTMALGSATVSSIPYTLDRLTPRLTEALARRAH